MKKKFIIHYEVIFLSLMAIVGDIKLFFSNLSFIKYIKNKILYPYLSIPSSVIIEGDVKLEQNIHIKQNVILSGNILIGRNTSLNNDCKILGDVEIGDNCLLAFNVFASSSKHNFRKIPSLPINDQDILQKLQKKIIIEDDCWIGINVAIMQGITIGKGSIVGSNSVITKDIQPYSIVVGVSKVISKRLDFIPPKKIEFGQNNELPYFYKGFLVREYEKKRYDIKDSFLTKNFFELRLNIENENYIILEVKKFIKKSILSFENQRFEIDSNNFIQIKIYIDKYSKLDFNVSEPILLKMAYLGKDKIS